MYSSDSLLEPVPSRFLLNSGPGRVLDPESREMRVCAHFTPCLRRSNLSFSESRLLLSLLFLLWGGGQVLEPQPEPEMWVFNYPIKCTIRHNYQCSEPKTAHNRHVIYCSLCLYYSTRYLMMPRCLHTALLPWR